MSSINGMLCYTMDLCSLIFFSSFHVCLHMAIFMYWFISGQVLHHQHGIWSFRIHRLGLGYSFYLSVNTVATAMLWDHRSTRSTHFPLCATTKPLSLPTPARLEWYPDFLTWQWMQWQGGSWLQRLDCTQQCAVLLVLLPGHDYSVGLAERLIGQSGGVFSLGSGAYF